MIFWLSGTCPVQQIQHHCTRGGKSNGKAIFFRAKKSKRVKWGEGKEIFTHAERILCVPSGHYNISGTNTGCSFCIDAATLYRPFTGTYKKREPHMCGSLFNLLRNYLLRIKRSVAKLLLFSTRTVYMPFANPLMSISVFALIARTLITTLPSAS